MLKLAILAAASSAVLVVAAPASAAINAPVPAANYIVFGGLDWAWAGPCAPFAGSSCNISGTDTLTAYQAGQGWRLPTMAEWLAKPAVANFEAAGSPCASAWFGSGWSHCDYGDANSGYIYSYGYSADPKTSDPASETWFVRGGAAVPEPAAWALMLAGFGLVGATVRRRRIALA